MISICSLTLTESSVVELLWFTCYHVHVESKPIFASYTLLLAAESNSMQNGCVQRKGEAS